MSKPAIKGLVPERRFPKFQGKGGWEIKEIGDVFDVTRGNVLSMNLVIQQHTKDTPYPVYSSQTKNNGRAGFYNEYLYENAITWTTDGANAGDVNYRSGKFYCTNVCGVLLNKKGYANSCIAELLNTVTRKYVSYVGNPKLMNGVMSKISIPFPEIDEQRKIADCLASIDELITAQTQKIDALKTHKKGLMQQLFPAKGETVPQRRFPEFRDKGEWDIKKVSEFAKITTGNKDTQNKVDDGKYPFFVRSQTVEKINSYSFDGEAVLTAGDGVGVGKIYHYIVGKFDFHQRVYSIYDFKKNVSGKYFYLFFSTHFNNRVMQLSAKNSVDSVRMAMIADMEIAVPDLDEQSRIVECLFSIEDLINAQAQKVESLKSHKKGLMQQLFPAMDEVSA